MYNELEIIIITICAILVIGIYIYRKATGDMWYGINWKLVWKHIQKLFK